MSPPALRAWGGRAYVPLFCKSNFSFLEGASHPEELLEQASHLGLRALALCDRNGVYGLVRAHVAAREHGVQLLCGSQVTIDDGTSLVVLAADREGYANLCRLLTRGRLRSDKGSCQVGWSEVCAHAGGVVALWGGEESLLAGASEPLFVGRQLKEAFGDRLYALLLRHRRAEEVDLERTIRSRAKHLEIPVVAGVEVLYHVPARRDLQDVLTCIRHGTSLATAGKLTRPNAQFVLSAPRAFEQLFADDPGAVQRTVEIAERCSFSLAELHYRYPSERLPDGSTSAEWLRQLTLQGARGRYPSGVPSSVAEQIERELALIGRLEYEGYFLTMWEIVRFCHEQGILCQGRGSAANSVVCYCLGITAIDPVRMNLLFERFISLERAEPPDIDLDIEHDRREEVIQHVYHKYGRTHAAMVAVVVRYRARSALREVGKVLGIPETSLDRLAKLNSHYEAATEESLTQAGLDSSAPTSQHLLRLVAEIQDFPRHLSIHPGGFLLGHEPVHDLVPIENGTMANRTVIQWDKDDLEELGLFKVDLLGLGALHQLHRCFELLRKHSQQDLSMATIPAEDPDTFAMIRRADTLGVFQIESRAQMAMLPRLKPRRHYDLVIEISIVRPGPIAGGMVHPYLRRRNGEEAIDYPHSSLVPVLEKTLGIPLFQEQVMQIAITAADYTPGEADQLRRDMAAWRRSGRIERHRERLVTRMKSKGIAEELALRVFEQIRGFGEYGFPESHAASFALIAYSTAWFKCHHPAIFTCALLNSLPMGFYAPSTLVDDAKRHRVVVRPIDVSYSEWECTLEEAPESNGGLAIRMGLSFIKGLGGGEAAELLARRAESGFRSIEDLVLRVALREDKLEKLAEAGALESLGGTRREAIWRVKGACRERANELACTTHEPEVSFRELSDFESIGWDYASSQHSSRGHPMAPIRALLLERDLPAASDIVREDDGKRVRYAGLVICRQRPGTAAGVVFMTLEDETGFVNVIVWPKVYERHRTVVKTSSFLGVSGRLQSEDGVVHIVADSLWIPELPLDPTGARSRDFH
ncbi:MAG: error-prone DNA polymerase [Planctomycetota bacterium]